MSTRSRSQSADRASELAEIEHEQAAGGGDRTSVVTPEYLTKILERTLEGVTTVQAAALGELDKKLANMHTQAFSTLNYEANSSL